MKGIYTVLVFTGSLIGSSFAQDAADESSLSCLEFQSVQQFIERTHLRFEEISSEQRAQLLSDAFRETPDALRLLGYPMLAAQFEKAKFFERSRAENRSAPLEICQMFESNLYRTSFLKAYARHLDPYSDFYLTEELDAKSSALEGEFVGVGIGTEAEENALRITEVVPGGPAENKLFIGDRILKIDGHIVHGLNDIEIRQRIRGQRGSRVHFEGFRGNEKFQVAIVRNVVHQQSVSYSWLEGKVLQIKISRFFRQTAELVERVIRSEGVKAKGFILDLRNNPGGLLQGARDVVNLFVPQGVVVYLKGRGVEDQVWALRDSRELRKPVVVLINSGTASAAEIVAGALQDYGRAILVGQKTYGKGSVQNIYETQTALGIRYRGGVKLTTLWYYLPSGRSVKSLDPDVATADPDANTMTHPIMPYSGPARIQVSRQVNGFEGFAKTKAGHLVTGKFQNSEEAGRAVLMKMLAAVPNSN